MTTLEMNTQNLKNLFHFQLDACSEEYHRALMEKFGDQIDSQELLETLNRVRGTQNLDLTKKVKTTKNPKEPKPAKKPKEPKDPSALCQARTWGDGSGEHQCTFGPGPNGLCTKHAKQELECCVPCSTTDEGNKRKGLFMGRINQWQDGVEGVLPYKDDMGLLRIEWASAHMKSIIQAALEDGSCKRPETGLSSKRGRKPTSKKSSTADAELAAIVPATLDTSHQVPTSETTQKAIMEELFGPDSDTEETSSEVPAKLETSSEVASDKDTSLEDSLEKELAPNEEPDDDHEANVQEKTDKNGKIWVVDMDDMSVYFWDEEDERHGTVIGIWGENGPELEDEYKWMLC